MTKKTKMNLQLWLGFILAIFGMCLIVVSFFIPPMGVIDASVLAAIGEIFTFSGALIGIDYHYKEKRYEHNTKTEDDNQP